MSGAQVDLNSDAAQSALSRLIFEEQQRIDDEIAQQQAAARQAVAQRQQRERQAQGDLIGRLAAVKPLYAERDAEAAAAIELLARFVMRELQIQRAEYQAQAGVPFSGDGGQLQQGIIAVRQGAGLPAHHDDLNIIATDEATAIALTALKCIMAGFIQPGRVIVGSCTVTFR